MKYEYNPTTNAKVKRQDTEDNKKLCKDISNIIRQWDEESNKQFQQER